MGNAAIDQMLSAALPYERLASGERTPYMLLPSESLNVPSSPMASVLAMSAMAKYTKPYSLVCQQLSKDPR
jgi:hypothetical protein